MAVAANNTDLVVNNCVLNLIANKEFARKYYNEIIEAPEKYNHGNLGLNKPES